MTMMDKLHAMQQMKQDYDSRLVEQGLKEGEYYEWLDEEYTPSCTAGDYSPSNPWDAPGMSIHDFI